MKTVLFYQNKGTNDFIFDPTVRDNCNDPFIYLKERINALGYEVVLCDEYSKPTAGEAVLFFTPPLIIDYSGLEGKIRWLKHLVLGTDKIKARTQFYGDCLKLGLKDKMVLVLWEGQAINPTHYRPSLHAKFNKILTWDDSLVDNKKFFKFLLPLARQEPLKNSISFKERKLLINISINKNSALRTELYSERCKTIEYFDKNFPNDFDLYGVGWEKPAPGYDYKFVCYRGLVKNKIDVLPNYKFALAYENMRDEPGYLTEKLFDCLRAGTVPIYWGAPNINDYVDPAAFIDRRKFKSNKELADFLINMNESNYQKYLKAGENYLRSDKFKLFLPPHFADIVINALKLNK